MVFIGIPLLDDYNAPQKWLNPHIIHVYQPTKLNIAWKMLLSLLLVSLLCSYRIRCVGLLSAQKGGKWGDHHGTIR
jgi:hypothetical protein